jgi:hypothetical protein
LTATLSERTVQRMREPNANEKYHDTNERDVEVKQDETVESSSAFDDKEIDRSAVKVLPGTGGPDDIGDTEATPDDYNRTGH